MREVYRSRWMDDRQNMTCIPIDEPDTIIYSGLSDDNTECYGVINRSSSAILCGYIIYPTSAEVAARYSDFDRFAHGGITWSQSAAHLSLHIQDGFNHVFQLRDEEIPDFYSQGFDCAHAGDRIPAHQKYNLNDVDDLSVYRDLRFVRDRIELMMDAFVFQCGGYKMYRPIKSPYQYQKRDRLYILD